MRLCEKTTTLRSITLNVISKGLNGESTLCRSKTEGLIPQRDIDRTTRTTLDDRKPQKESNDFTMSEYAQYDLTQVSTLSSRVAGRAY